MLKYYSANEENPRKEELNNQQYVGREVWVKGEISEVADPVSGHVVVALASYDEDGEEQDNMEIHFPADSDDLKFLNEEDQLIDD